MPRRGSAIIIVKYRVPVPYGGDGKSTGAETGGKGETVMDFSEEQIERYSRHIILPEVGGVGQAKLLGAKVFVLGAGGLGSPALYYLAAAGVGTIGIADGDVVELTNLQRQIIHDTPRVGVKKTESAKQTIEALNPDVKVVTYAERVTADNIREMIRDYDIVLDGSDNFPTRFLMNDAAYFEGKPLVSGSMFRFEGQVSVFQGHEEDLPCYRCLYGEPPPPGLAPSCNEAGILGALAGVIGVVQAVEAIKLILGVGETLAGRLLVFDALKMSFRKMEVRKDPGCQLCGDKATIKELITYEEVCEVPEAGVALISPEELEEKLDSEDPPVLLDIRDSFELKSALGHLEGIVHIPLGELERLYPKLTDDKDKEIAVVCRSGHRAIAASKLLVAKDFGRVSILDGGMIAWRKYEDEA